MTIIRQTARTKVKRAPKRASYERQLINDIIEETLIGHLAFHTHDNTHTIPLPFWRMNDSLYCHFSVQSRLANLAAYKTQVSISFVIVDGLVLAKSAFHHSMNYRSVVVYGEFEAVTDEQEKRQALKAFMDWIDPKRWETVRPPNRKELNATMVLKIGLNEAVAMVRQGPPNDKASDLTREVWAGVIPCVHNLGRQG